MDLTGVTLPAGLKVIGMNAFANNAGLTSVDIPAGVERLDYGVFSDCTSLSSVTLRQGLKRIGENVFDDCTALKSITIPDGVEVLSPAVRTLPKSAFPTPSRRPIPAPFRTPNITATSRTVSRCTVAASIWA